MRPGVPGLSENIRVKSIAGRYLEHSRVFYWKHGGNEQIYIGSADMMPRNLDRRVEALARVDAPEVRQRLKAYLDLAMADNSSSWWLGPDGAWELPGPPADDRVISLQDELMKESTARA